MLKQKAQNDVRILLSFLTIGKKINQSSALNADQENPTLGSMDYAGNSVNRISGIIRLPSGWDFSLSAPETDDRFYLC